MVLLNSRRIAFPFTSNLHLRCDVFRSIVIAKKFTINFHDYRPHIYIYIYVLIFDDSDSGKKNDRLIAF